MASEHDKRYKKLFSHPYFTQKLLESFVHEEFISGLDFSTLKRLDKSFVTEDYSKMESDLIFSIDFKGKPVYIFLLIEFQSTVDKMMSIRFLRYICELYSSLHKKAESGLFPAVFPLLLYNGEKKWTAELNIEKMIEKTIPDKYIPKFEYYPILENQISKKSLQKIRNAVSAVFYLENLTDDIVIEEIDRIIEIIKDEDLSIINEFFYFFNNFLSEKEEIGLDLENFRKIENLMEVKTMFATTLKKMEKRYIEQGIEQGIEKGIGQGIEQGEQIIIKNLVSQSFSVDEIVKLTGIDKNMVLRLMK